MTPFTTLESPAVLLNADDIDTDQIIPARFLTTTSRVGLGKHAFADWRYNALGAPIEGFALNRSGAHSCRILVAGRNFGCGSSREHAPWALADFGFRVVIAPSFADIFRNNAYKNGMLPIALSPEMHERLVHALRAAPDARLRVDLQAQTVSLPNATVERFDVPPFVRHCLLEGVDQLGALLSYLADAERWERTHGSAINTVSA